MRFVTASLYGVFLCGALLTSSAAWAGFGFGQGASEKEVVIAAPSHGVSPAKTAGKVVAPVDPSAPALEVYNERYVPDPVKKKYGLADDWYDSKTGRPVPVTLPAPQTLLPNDMVAMPPVGPLDVAASPPITPPSVAQPVAAPVPLLEAKAVENQSDVPKNYVQSWRARKGELVHDVLHRWAEREHTELMWASPDNPALPVDFSFFGTFADAVSHLMSATGKGNLHSQYRSEGLDPVMMSPASTITTNTVVPADDQGLPLPAAKSGAAMTLPSEEPPVTVPITVKGVSMIQPKPLASTPDMSGAQAFVPTIKDSGPETRWLALTGAPLAEVLRVWAEDADVALVWQSEKNFALKESVSKKGTFEDAVFMALNQYNDDAIRPVGEMYRDKDTGQKVLVIRTDAGQ